jgi:hypothetical protein
MKEAHRCESGDFGLLVWCRGLEPGDVPGLGHSESTDGGHLTLNQQRPKKAAAAVCDQRAGGMDIYLAVFIGDQKASQHQGPIAREADGLLASGVV